MIKKLLLGIIFACVLAAVTPVGEVISYAADSNPSFAGKAAYLMDYDTGTVIYKQNENDKLPIASMTKIMTSLLVFESIDENKLSLDDKITVSENASSMGGSQVFLDANSVHTVNDLLKTVIVASANDSSVALAEAVSGSESAFVAKMNERAKSLGMNNTNFTNCTGLPAVNAYSSAKDVSIMLKALLSHEKYYEYAKIWLEDYTHPDGRITTITNTNKLVRFYNGCDGGKTGFTSEAKFCLSASAKRNGMRLICTVIGVDNGKTRFKCVSDMFDYAFANYENKILLKAGDSIENDVEILRGKKSDLTLTVAENVTVFSKKGETGNVETVYELPDKIKAPVKRGDLIGKVSVVRDGKVISETDVIVAEDIGKANLLDSIKKILANW